MPPTTLTANLDQSIGQPPKKLAIISIASFLITSTFFYYLLFIFQFNYKYSGSFIKDKSSFNILTLKVENGKNLSADRLSNWKLECQAEGDLNPVFVDFFVGKNIIVLKKNSLFEIKNTVNFQPDYSRSYSITLKSPTFYERLFHLNNY
jgi:hypothetical protein